MANDKLVSIDQLVSAERTLIIVSLELYKASIKRAINSEKNSAVKEIRVRDLAAVDALIVRFL